MAEERNWNAGPLDMNLPLLQMDGSFPLFVLADLPQGSAIQFVNKSGLVDQVTPGPHIPAGAMLVVLLPEVAAHIRPEFRRGLEAHLRAGQNGARPL